ncbi:MAG: 23S rRNA (uracil(1939)-C(5))-methyltransferase RlmD, partial [Oscillospiraceae bacterium]
ISHAKFICADASNAAAELFQDGIRPDVVIMDPPRKGSDVATMDAVVSMAPSRIVMVSCNAATAARDCKYLSQQGYTPTAIQPVDMFPRTKHVECVVLMSRKQ